MKNKYTKEDVITSLDRFKQISNGKYTKSNYVNLGLKPTYPTICSLFEGGWKEALKEAGLTPTSTYTYSEEEMIQQLKECYMENNQQISHTIYRESKRKPSITAIEDRFGSFSQALIQAGIEPNPVQNKRFSDEEMIDALWAFYHKNHGIVTYDSYEDAKKTPSASAIRKRFKTWNKALEEAGIPLNQKKESRFTEEEMITALQRVSEHIPYIVSRPLYKKYALASEPSVITIERHFKTWNNALQKADLPTIPKYTKEEMLKSIEQFFEYYGEQASNDLYRKVDWLPGLTTINRHFGSWEQALKEIKHDLKYSHYTKEYAIAQIRACADKYGTPLSIQMYQESEYKPSITWIKKTFGSWKKAKNIAGIN